MPRNQTPTPVQARHQRRRQRQLCTSRALQRRVPLRASEEEAVPSRRRRCRLAVACPQLGRPQPWRSALRLSRCCMGWEQITERRLSGPRRRPRFTCGGLWTRRTASLRRAPQIRPLGWRERTSGMPLGRTTCSGSPLLRSPAKARKEWNQVLAVLRALHWPLGAFCGPDTARRALLWPL